MMLKWASCKEVAKKLIYMLAVVKAGNELAQVRCIKVKSLTSFLTDFLSVLCTHLVCMHKY